MDLSVVYTKTAKGLRARASIIGGISSQLMKVLSYVDGTSKAETILDKYDEISELKLAAALTQLEAEGYIKPVITTRPGDDDWALATIFAPMEVEELQSAEEAEAEALRQAEYKAKIEEDIRLQAERKAREQLEEDQAKEKIKAELKVKAQLEVDRIAREAEETRKKAEAEAHAKAEEKARLEAERKAKIEEEARQKAELKAQEAAARKAKAEEDARLRAELKAREAAEKIRVLAEAQLKERREQARIAQEAEEARKKAQDEAKENARREIERITREAEEAQKKSEMEASAKAEQEARLEAERVAKAEAEAKLEAERKAQAEEEARLEAEQKAKAEDEARLAAEREAEAEAEKARAKAEAEEKTKADEKERARQDIARIVREAEEARKKAEADAKEARLSAKQKEKAAEEQQKAEAEANAKAELEAKLEAERKIKADEEARLKAENKAKSDAEQDRVDAEAKEKASADANLKASLAMQSFALNTVEEKQSSEAKVSAKSKQAQLQAKLKAKAEFEAEQIRAKYEAEESARADEKEIARQEMERISREAELERQKQHQAIAVAPVAAIAADAAAAVDADASPIEVRWANPDQDDDDDDFEEEERIAGEVEKVGLEIKKKVKRVAEVEGREEIIRTAKAEAELKAKTKIESKTSVVTKNLGKWATVVRKVLLIYLPPAILLVLVLLHFINISPLVEPVEKLASESLGAPVKIEEVRASLWPRPHLELKNVAIGADSAQIIESVNIVPYTSSLSEDVKMLKSLEIAGLEIDQESFGQPLQWISGLSKAQHLQVDQITLSKIVFKIRDLELAPFDGKVALTESRELKSIDLSTDDETLAMQITPQGSSFDIAFTGTNWALPMNPKFIFSELKAKGTLNQSLIFFNLIEGTIYGGSFTGKAALDWSNQWSVAGNFDLTNAALPETMKAFASNASIDGKFNMTGIFSCKSDQAVTLTDAPEITASFEALNGKINGVELTHAVLSKTSQSLMGDSTRFDKLTGSVKIKDGAYQYRQLVLKSDQFYAEGNVDIQPNQDISGKISANLAAQSRRLQASFNLAGTVNNVQRQ